MNQDDIELRQEADALFMYGQTSTEWLAIEKPVDLKEVR